MSPITAAEWAAIRPARVAALHTRWRALPREYQEWVIRSGQNRGIATLRRDTALGPGEVQTYDVLISRCERAIALAANPNRRKK